MRARIMALYIAIAYCVLLIVLLCAIESESSLPTMI